MGVFTPTEAAVVALLQPLMDNKILLMLAIMVLVMVVGTVLNVVAGVGRLSMDDVTRGVVPFMLAEFAIMFLMVLFPWLVTWPAKLFTG